MEKLKSRMQKMKKAVLFVCSSHDNIGTSSHTTFNCATQHLIHWTEHHFQSASFEEAVSWSRRDGSLLSFCCFRPELVSEVVHENLENLSAQPCIALMLSKFQFELEGITICQKFIIVVKQWWMKWELESTWCTSLCLHNAWGCSLLAHGHQKVIFMQNTSHLGLEPVCNVEHLNQKWMLPQNPACANKWNWISVFLPRDATSWSCHSPAFISPKLQHGKKHRCHQSTEMSSITIEKMWVWSLAFVCGWWAVCLCQDQKDFSGSTWANPSICVTCFSPWLAKQKSTCFVQITTNIDVNDFHWLTFSLLFLLLCHQWQWWWQW